MDEVFQDDVVCGLDDFREDEVGGAGVEDPAVEVGQRHEVSEAVDDASGHCLVGDDLPLFLAGVDGLELSPHLGVVDGHPEALLQVL
jgi:hypothetical protein